jgi:hypothetical protein
VSGAGAIDTIQCHGRTASASISVAYNELLQAQPAGALNDRFETDGPETLTMNMGRHCLGIRDQGLSTGSRCPNRRKAEAPDGNAGHERQKLTPGFSMTGTNPGYMVISRPTIMGLRADPNQTHNVNFGRQPFQSNGSTGLNYISTANTPGCSFNTTRTNTGDISWLPGTDVFGNQVSPSGAYLSGTVMSGGHLVFGGASTAAANWDNLHKAAYNATDHAAYRARTNASMEATMFVIGLGGQGLDPPDYTLLQRIANDPKGDTYNTPALYSACAVTPSCVTYPAQPPGSFIYSSNHAQLRQAFLVLSSQILRLSQ